MRWIGALMIVGLATLPARAESAAASACKAQLSPLGQQIYTATLAQKPTPTTARSIVKGEVEKLIASGTTTLMEGRTAAMAAGKCLEMLE